MIEISSRLSGSQGLNEWLHRFKEKQLLFPVNVAHEPRANYLCWHQKELFWGGMI